MAITTKVVAVIAVILLVVGIAAGGFLITSASEVEPQPEVVFGALLSLTGYAHSIGESSEAALELAVEDINEYLSRIGSETRVRVIVEDTKTDPAVALEKLQSLAGKGIKVVIGPQSSAEVETVKAYADENGILLVSPSSVAPSLAIPGDNVFRFCPDATHQAEAIARLMWEDGVRVVIPLWRSDVWGDDLSEATKGCFEELGGTVVDGISYHPTTEDFSTELGYLNSKVSQAIAQYGDVDSVGIYLLAFGEVVPIFLQAQNYTSISTVKWYGNSAVALDKELISNPPAARFAIRTGFPNPTYAVGKTEKYELVEDQIRKKIGRPPDNYALAAYDALWVATLSYLATEGTNDSATLKKALQQTAGYYFGATGWTALNEAGDRKFGNYDFWAVREANGAFLWERMARYQVDPSSPGRLIYERNSSLVPTLRVIVVHSYHEGWVWDQYIQKGIVEGLSRNGYLLDRDYEMEEFYMDTKVTYTTPEQIEQRAEIALDLIAEFDPDIVFVNDDNALKYVAVEYTKRHPDKKLPFVSSGVNVDPTIYDPLKSLKMPGGPITGALERFPYYECFSLGKRLFPNASKIVLLADSSSSSTFVVDTFRERYLDKIVDSPLQVIGPIQVETFKEWKKKVAEYQTKADFVGILTYHQLRAENGEVVPAPEVVDWTIHNSKLPELGVLTFHAEDGFLAAAGVSGYKTGIYVGVIGGEILEGSNPATIPIVDPKVVDIAFNLERAEMLGVKIPATELAEATEVFHSIR